MQRTDYVYVNEATIEPLLKCRICRRPFVNPVVTRDGERLCRLCVIEEKTSFDNRHVDLNASFLDNLVDMDEGIIREMLGLLRIKCPDCHHQKDFYRKDYHEHLRTQCPKRIVLCKACDLKCPWSGTQDRYDDHVSQCIFELLRPALSERCQHQAHMEECRRKSREQQDEIEKLKRQIEECEKRVETPQQGLTAVAEIDPEQKQRYERMEKVIEDIREQFTEQNLRQDEIRNDIEQMKAQLQQLKVNVPAPSPPQANQLDEALQKITENLAQHDSQMKNYQEHYATQFKQVQRQETIRRNETLCMRQLCDQHTIQIRLLSRKKCLISAKPVNIIDARLQSILDTIKPNADVDLTSRNFNSQDIESIARVAIIERRCRKLRLDSNEITAKGANVLADALHGNNTLIELHLSTNNISDSGAHALAQVLSINNSTLTWLEIHANNITDEGAEYLADMLKTNKSLVLLGLSFNQITDRGVQHLANAIAYFNETLQWLHLASNKGITDESVGNLQDMLTNNRSLQAVWLNNCSLSNNATRKLKRAVEANTNFILEV